MVISFLQVLVMLPQHLCKHIEMIQCSNDPASSLQSPGVDFPKETFLKVCIIFYVNSAHYISIYYYLYSSLKQETSGNSSFLDSHFLG